MHKSCTNFVIVDALLFPGCSLRPSINEIFHEMRDADHSQKRVESVQINKLIGVYSSLSIVITLLYSTLYGAEQDLVTKEN